VFQRGTLKQTDSKTTYSFDEQQPLVGLQGYETTNQIKALGFVMYNCSHIDHETTLQTESNLTQSEDSP
jgi:hypothetical protein